MQARRFSSDALGISWLWTGKVSRAATLLPHIDTPVMSGMPDSVAQRHVRIYQPAKQSGKNATRLWKLDFEVTDKWYNPTMGWVSSADPVHAIDLKFPSKESATAYAVRQGLHYWIDEPRESRPRKKVYADNFSYSPDKLRIVKTK